MAAIDVRITQTIQRANTCQQLASAALDEFNAYSAAFRWVEAEEARAKYLAHCEAYLDGLTSAYRLMQRGK